MNFRTILLSLALLTILFSFGCVSQQMQNGVSENASVKSDINASPTYNASNPHEEISSSGNSTFQSPETSVSLDENHHSRLIVAFTDLSGNVSSFNVSISGASVMIGNTTVNLSLNSTQIDLVSASLADVPVVDATVPSGNVSMLSISVGNSTAVINGTLHNISLPSNTLNFSLNSSLLPNETQIEEIDFLLNESIIMNDSGVLFVPKAVVNSIGNASVVVSKSDDGSHYLEIENGKVEVKHEFEYEDGEMIKKKEIVISGHKENHQEDEIKIKVKNGKAKIDVEIDGKKVILHMDGVSSEDDAWSKVENITGVSREDILNSSSAYKVKVEVEIKKDMGNKDDAEDSKEENEDSSDHPKNEKGSKKSEESKKTNKDKDEPSDSSQSAVVSTLDSESSGGHKKDSKNSLSDESSDEENNVSGKPEDKKDEFHSGED